MHIHLFEHEPGDYSQNIETWAIKNHHSIRRTPVYKTNALPELDDFEFLIVAGGPQHIWEEDKHPWLRNEKNFIAAAAASGKHIMGICLGAQLLAEVLGGTVFTNSLEELGWCDVRLTAEGLASPLFNNTPPRFTMFQWHSDHFTLPAGTTRLASSDAAENQAFISENGRMLGIQFHPDFDLRSIQHMLETDDAPWPSGPFVTPKNALIEQTASMQEPYWLMEILLNNLSVA